MLPVPEVIRREISGSTYLLCSILRRLEIFDGVRTYLRILVPYFVREPDVISEMFHEFVEATVPNQLKRVQYGTVPYRTSYQ